jgi:hypothetical protein
MTVPQDDVFDRFAAGLLTFGCVMFIVSVSDRLIFFRMTGRLCE